jgi:TonB family protein
MNSLLVYMLKAALYLTAFYLIYYMLLSKDTSYMRNRLFILLSLASAMIMPFFALQNIKTFDIRFFGKYLSEVFVTGSSGDSEKLNSGLSAFALSHLVSLVYITGTAVFVFKLLTDLTNLIFLIQRHKNKESRIIRFHSFKTAGFSAMGYVFINARLYPDEAAEIIKHEQNHLKSNHFVDIIFIGIIKAFQWFNPAIYLFDRSLRAIHEYQADRQCLTSGVPVVNYQNLLLNQVFKSNAFIITNSFSNPSLIKNRMMMMTKKRTSAIASLKLIIVVPIIGVLFLIVSSFRDNNKLSINQTVNNLDKRPTMSEPSAGKLLSPPTSPPTSETIELSPEIPDEVPFVVVEEMPEFPGGDAALLKYIAANTTYPEKAKKKNIEGRVIIRFCVRANGSVNQISIIKGVDPEVDAEALKVVGTLPDFKPGRQGGKAVPVWYMVPITFTLK